MADNNFLLTLKARSFMGCISIRTGLFVIAFFQIITGLALYFAFGYLRPSLHGTMWSLAIGFIASSLLGIWGAWKREQAVEVIYFITFIIGTVYLLLSVLDFSDVMQLMPRAPVGASQSLLLSKLHSRVEMKHTGLKSVLYENHPNFAEEHSLLIKILQHEAPEETVGEATRRIYEDMPFVPHRNETEGQSEEVSKSELPPEVEKLSPEAQAEVIAITKMQKRPMKLLAAAFFGIVFLLYIYFSWIILTFTLNKCKSIDELAGHPSQFEPLM